MRTPPTYAEKAIDVSSSIDDAILELEKKLDLNIGARGEEAAEGHVIGAGFSGLLGQSQVAMTGNADNFAGPESLSRAGNAAVTLADMDTVGLNLCGQGRVVVDQKEGAILPAQGLKLAGTMTALCRGGGLVPVLQQAGATAQGSLCGGQ